MFDSKKEGSVTKQTNKPLLNELGRGRIPMAFKSEHGRRFQRTMTFSLTSHHRLMILFICMTVSETQKTQGRRFTGEKDKNFAESIEANAFKTSRKMLTIFRRFDQ